MMNQCSSLIQYENFQFPLVHVRYQCLFHVTTGEISWLLLLYLHKNKRWHCIFLVVILINTVTEIRRLPAVILNVNVFFAQRSQSEPTFSLHLRLWNVVMNSNWILYWDYIKIYQAILVYIFSKCHIFYMKIDSSFDTFFFSKTVLHL